MSPFLQAGSAAQASYSGQHFWATHALQGSVDFRLQVPGIIVVVVVVVPPSLVARLAASIPRIELHPRLVAIKRTMQNAALFTANTLAREEANYKTLSASSPFRCPDQ